MAKKWTLANAVKRFTPHQIDSLNRNKGNLNKRQFDSLIKEMQCIYEMVEVEGKGRDRIIATDKRRKVKAKKEDKRQFNKGQAPAHSMNLALMVMSKMNNIDNKARTKKGWATYFELISSAEQDIMNGIFSKEVLKPYKTFMIELGIMEDGEENVFQDLAYTLTKVAKGQLQTVLKQAAGEGMKLIRIITSWKGKVKDSKEPIVLDKGMAEEINSTENLLLEKHGISKVYSLMIKNCPKTKAYKAEWLEYIENVEDTEGDAMQLQYIYEVFRIELLNEKAFDVFINTHYPSEVASFNILKNEQSYHSKLLDYVVENAQKRHDKSLESKSKQLTMDESTKETLAMFNMTEDEAIAQIDEAEMRRELTPYEELLKSDEYVECISKIHVQLHSMSVIESEEVKAESHINDELKRKEFAQLVLTKPAEADSEKRVMKRIRNYHESYMDTEQHEELTMKEPIEQKQANQTNKEIEIEKIKQQSTIFVDKPFNEPPLEFYEIEDYEYQEVMADIKEEIREYEDKYGDRAMEHMALDAVMREIETERASVKWDKLFEGGKPVKWGHTTNKPLELFHRIRDGHIC